MVDFPDKKQRGTVFFSCTQMTASMKKQMTDIKLWSGTDFNGFSAWRGEKKAHDSQTAAWKEWKQSSEHGTGKSKTERHSERSST